METNGGCGYQNEEVTLTDDVIIRKKVLTFLGHLTNWNFNEAAVSACLIDDFPQQAYYHVLSLSNEYDNLGHACREGTVFNVIPGAINDILRMLNPWLKKHFQKEGLIETFCSIIK